MKDAFDAIYRGNLWQGTDSASGPGSGRIATEPVARALVDLVRELRCESVLDVGCGDGAWMPDLPGYVGIDASSEAITRARARHPERVYLEAAGHTLSGLPQHTWDLIVCRDAMQHLPLADAMVLVASMFNSGRALLLSTFVGGLNEDVPVGDAYSPDLTREPFWMPQPDRLIFDGWDYVWPGRIRDHRKHLGLWLL